MDFQTILVIVAILGIIIGVIAIGVSRERKRDKSVHDCDCGCDCNTQPGVLRSELEEKDQLMRSTVFTVKKGDKYTNYKAVKKKGTRGSCREDYEFFDDLGCMIEDIVLMDMMYDSVFGGKYGYDHYQLFDYDACYADVMEDTEYSSTPHMEEEVEEEISSTPHMEDDPIEEVDNSFLVEEDDSPHSPSIDTTESDSSYRSSLSDESSYDSGSDYDSGGDSDD